MIHLLRARRLSLLTLCPRAPATVNSQSFPKPIYRISDTVMSVILPPQEVSMANIDKYPSVACSVASVCPLAGHALLYLTLPLVFALLLLGLRVFFPHFLSDG